ncbi:hypothetical protein ABEB36_014981 [Hypothenemus hampei]|uniref:Uncharacterized protein n=1 Tax=Hypothenemus hampei TaxID=57062 RepID=A0ABD1E2E5_HYPHA
MFSNNEKVDILIIFGQCGRNAAAGERVYREEYWDKRHYLSRQYILYLIQKMRQEPIVEQEKFIISEEEEINTIALVEMNPTASTIEIKHELDVSSELLEKY